MSEHSQRPAAPPSSCAVVKFGGERRTGIWRAWFLLILAPLLLLSISMGYAILAVVLAHGDRSVIGPAMGRAVPFIVMVNHGLLFVLMLWFMRLDGMSMATIGWPIPNPGVSSILREAAVGIAAGGVLYVIHQYVFSSFVAWLAKDVPNLRLASNSDPLGSNVILALVLGVVLGGLVEEQLYRGYVLVRLSERFSVAMAAVPMLFFFGLLHFGLGWTGMLVATLTGLNLTLLFVWRRSLISAVLAHAIVNILVIAL